MNISGGIFVDVGCGTGNLWNYVSGRFDQYIGVDVLRYEGFPEGATFLAVDMDSGGVPLPDSVADVVAAVETIEHVENPRRLVREIVRLVRPGGWIVVTTPNQLSWLSKLTLILKNQFNAFQDACYPAHITALLESDLIRMARECGLTSVSIRFTGSGRIPGTASSWPTWISSLRPRSFSDNVLMLAQKPEAGVP